MGAIKRKSFTHKIAFELVMQIVLLVMLFTSYTVYIYRNTRDTIAITNGNLLSLYGKDLDLKLTNAQRILEQLVYDNANYVLLQSPNEADRYYSSRSLFLSMQNMISFDRSVDLIVVGENTYGKCLVADNVRLSYDSLIKVQDFVLKCSAVKGYESAWSVYEDESAVYIYKMYVWQGRAAGVFINADNFLKTTENNNLKNVYISLVAPDGKMIAGTGEMYRKASIFKSSYDLLAPSFRLCMEAAYPSLLLFLAKNGFSVFVIVLVTLVCALFLMRSIKKNILTPMSDMGEYMASVQKGAIGVQISGPYPNEEFEQLRNLFNKMMKEIVDLKIEKYEKLLEINQSELKTIKLQLSPHFFLNALTTISSLSQQKKNDEIVSYINVLSENLRYIFKSGLHTVELRQELEHLRSYFEIQELKYPECVFYMISQEEGLDDWKIPQMILHTIIENEYKYAVVMGRLLSIYISIKKVEIDGIEYLCIDIEDDGKGYPQEFLESFAASKDTEKDGRRVGLWSIRKILFLMYDRDGLFTIENCQPHGCRNRFLIPPVALHEVAKD